MLNKIFGALAATALSVMPAAATIDEGTTGLLNYVESQGIPVFINDHEACASDKYLGVYIHRGMQRQLVLCPGDTITDLDHAVVRHEVWHAIQHCVNAARGTNTNTPVNTNTNNLMEYVYANLPEEMIELVVELYERDQWLLELEANVAMTVLTAAEIQDLFKQACVADW